MPERKVKVMSSEAIRKVNVKARPNTAKHSQATKSTKTTERTQAAGRTKAPVKSTRKPKAVKSQEEVCREFLKNEQVNPRTGRSIQIGKPAHKALVKECQAFRMAQAPAPIAKPKAKARVRKTMKVNSGQVAQPLKATQRPKAPRSPTTKYLHCDNELRLTLPDADSLISTILVGEWRELIPTAMEFIQRATSILLDANVPNDMRQLPMVHIALAVIFFKYALPLGSFERKLAQYLESKNIARSTLTMYERLIMSKLNTIPNGYTVFPL